MYNVEQNALQYVLQRLERAARTLLMDDCTAVALRAPLSMQTFARGTAAHDEVINEDTPCTDISDFIKRLVDEDTMADDGGNLAAMEWNKKCRCVLKVLLTLISSLQGPKMDGGKKAGAFCVLLICRLILVSIFRRPCRFQRLDGVHYDDEAQLYADSSYASPIPLRYLQKGWRWAWQQSRPYDQNVLCSSNNTSASASASVRGIAKRLLSHRCICLLSNNTSDIMNGVSIRRDTNTTATASTGSSSGSSSGPSSRYRNGRMGQRAASGLNGRSDKSRSSVALDPTGSLLKLSRIIQQLIQYQYSINRPSIVNTAIDAGSCPSPTNTPTPTPTSTPTTPAHSTHTASLSSAASTASAAPPLPPPAGAAAGAAAAVQMSAPTTTTVAAGAAGDAGAAAPTVVYHACAGRGWQHCRLFPHTLLMDIPVSHYFADALKKQQQQQQQKQQRHGRGGGGGAPTTTTKTNSTSNTRTTGKAISVGTSSYVVALFEESLEFPSNSLNDINVIETSTNNHRTPSSLSDSDRSHNWARPAEYILLDQLVHNIVMHHVTLVACQKRVHPYLQRRLQQHDILCLERISVRYMSLVQKLSGARLYGSMFLSASSQPPLSTSTPAPASVSVSVHHDVQPHEAMQVQVLDMSSLGYLSGVNIVHVNGMQPLVSLVGYSKRPSSLVSKAATSSQNNTIKNSSYPLTPGEQQTTARPDNSDNLDPSLLEFQDYLLDCFAPDSSSSPSVSATITTAQILQAPQLQRSMTIAELVQYSTGVLSRHRTCHSMMLAAPNHNLVGQLQAACEDCIHSAIASANAPPATSTRSSDSGIAEISESSQTNGSAASSIPDISHNLSHKARTYLSRSVEVWHQCVNDCMVAVNGCREKNNNNNNDNINTNNKNGDAGFSYTGGGSVRSSVEKEEEHRQEEEEEEEEEEGGGGGGGGGGEAMEKSTRFAPSKELLRVAMEAACSLIDVDEIILLSPSSSS